MFDLFVFIIFLTVKKLKTIWRLARLGVLTLIYVHILVLFTFAACWPDVLYGLPLLLTLNLILGAAALLSVLDVPFTGSRCRRPQKRKLYILVMQQAARVALMLNLNVLSLEAWVFYVVLTSSAPLSAVVHYIRLLFFVVLCLFTAICACCLCLGCVYHARDLSDPYFIWTLRCAWGLVSVCFGLAVSVLPPLLLLC